MIHLVKKIISRIREFTSGLAIFQPRSLRLFYSKKLSDVEHFNLPDASKKIPLHIFTVAYNNALLLDHQERLIRKNIIDDYVFIVADNSTDPEKRKLISQKCREKNIGYIAMPPNPKTLSYSHAVCLNWLCKHYLPLYLPEAFGFIDHDLYPIKRTSLLQQLKDQPVYGHSQGTMPHWYLWAGFCFFRSNAAAFDAFNFSPVGINDKHLDTGGGNWKKIYSKLDVSTLKFPEHQYIALREGEVFQSDKMEVIGDWLHSFNGSYWMKVPPKENLLNEYLSKL